MGEKGAKYVQRDAMEVKICFSSKIAFSRSKKTERKLKNMTWMRRQQRMEKKDDDQYFLHLFSFRHFL